MDIGLVVLIAIIALVLFYVFKNKKSGDNQEFPADDTESPRFHRVDKRPVSTVAPAPPLPKLAARQPPVANEPSKPSIVETAPLADPGGPVIVTRTSVNKSSVKFRDTSAGERTWTEEEAMRAVALYKSGHSTNSIAVSMQIDHKDIICKLTRKYFSFNGDLEDLSAATNNRLRWTVEEHQVLLSRLEVGATLESLMKSFGRTGLALGWRIFSQRLAEL